MRKNECLRCCECSPQGNISLNLPNATSTFVLSLGSRTISPFRTSSTPLTPALCTLISSRSSAKNGTTNLCYVSQEQPETVSIDRERLVRDFVTHLWRGTGAGDESRFFGEGVRLEGEGEIGEGVARCSGWKGERSRDEEGCGEGGRE